MEDFTINPLFLHFSCVTGEYPEYCPAAHYSQYFFSLLPVYVLLLGVGSKLLKGLNQNENSEGHIDLLKAGKTC